MQAYISQFTFKLVPLYLFMLNWYVTWVYKSWGVRADAKVPDPITHMTKSIGRYRAIVLNSK